MQLLKSAPGRQRGETLMSLLVGLVVGLVVLGGASLVYLSAARANSTTLQLSRTNQELKAIMDVMVRDIRRAGRSAAAIHCIGGASCTDGLVGGSEDWTLSSSQIDFTYDRNANGSQDSDECHGFRRAEESGVGRIEMKTDCTPTWQSLSTPNSTHISNFATTGETRCQSAGSRQLAVRKVRIYLEAQSGGVTRRMCQTIRLKKDAVVDSCSETSLSTSAPFTNCPT